MKYNFYKDTPLEKTAGKATDKLLDREMQELLGKDYKKKDWSKYREMLLPTLSFPLL